MAQQCCDNIKQAAMGKYLNGIRAQGATPPISMAASCRSDTPLSTDGRAYYIKNSCHLSWRTPSAYTSPFQEDVFPGIEAQESFLQQAAMQTETMLYLAQRLQLQPLMDRMHAFIASSTYRTDGWLDSVRLKRSCSLILQMRS